MNIVIRLTDKCTQSCKHCLFCCSEDNNQHMLPDIAKDIVNFLHKQKFSTLTDHFQLMGGEIFLNPYYKEILDIFYNGANRISITTNGDWIENHLDFIETLFEYCDKINFRISLTQYHNKQYENKLRQWMVYNVHKFRKMYVINNIKRLIPNERVIKNKLKEEYDTCIIDAIWLDEFGNIYACPLFNYKIGNIYDEYFKYDNQFADFIFGSIKFLIKWHSGSSCITCQNLYKKYLRYCKNEMKSETDVTYYYSCFEHDLSLENVDEEI